MKRFKAKRKVKYGKILTFIIIVIFTLITLKYIITNKLFEIDPVTTIKSSNNYSENININQIGMQILKLDINKPTTILKQTIPYTSPNKEYYVIKNDQEQLEEITEPEIYIYNTHQKEAYQNKSLEPTPTVMTSSYYLQEILENKGIKTIVEENSIENILSENNWNYNNSYKASRINLEKIKEQYPTIKIFIDLHRDAVSKTSSTVNIDGKDYAKVLFVIGKEHDNYLQNLAFTNSINEIILKKRPEITKGILQKAGPGVNGIYNQDIAPNVILIEIGGNENTIEEATNTLDIIADVIEEKINENK